MTRSILTYKTNENAHPRASNDTAPFDMAAWQAWIADQIRAEFGPLHEAIGRVVAQERKDVKQVHEGLTREIDLLRREFNVLRQEVSVEAKLTDLRERIPDIPDIRRDLEKKIDALTNELYMTKADLIQAQDVIKTLRMKVGQCEYEILDVDKQLRLTKLMMLKPANVKVTLPESSELPEPAKYEAPFYLPPVYVIEHKTNDQTPEN